MHGYITVIKASCCEMLRMAFNRHELARYFRQRKWGLLMQLILIVCCILLSLIMQAEEMFGNCAGMPVL